MLIVPSREKVVGIVRRLALVELHDPLDAILVAVRVGHHRVRSKSDPFGGEHQVFHHLTRRSQVFVEQRR